jgi:predicted phage-related endonuclease
MNAIIEHPPEWHAERLKGIGGSDATRIMAGDTLALWEEKTGRREPEDLSGVLPVQIGSFTEPFNVAWFEMQTGRAVTVNKARLWCDFMHCEVDGFTDYGATVFEAKHLNPFKTDMGAILERYIWQLHHIMQVAERDRAVLSVLFGNTGFEYVEIDKDPDIMARLLDAEAAFWRHVQDDTPPPSAAPETVAIAFDDMREVDMTGDNQWGDAAATFVEHKGAAKAFEGAKKALKEITPADARRCFGAGVEITRGKSGALTVKESRE